jgi:uncharacterized protein
MLGEPSHISPRHAQVSLKMAAIQFPSFRMRILSPFSGALPMLVSRIAIVSLVLAAPLASAASFDCAKAKSPIEKMVCAHPELSRQDEVLAASYKRAIDRVGNPVALRASQRTWLTSYAVRDCKAADCLKTVYAARIAWLDAAVKSPWNGHFVRYFDGKPDMHASEIVLIASSDGKVSGEGSSLWMGPNAANGGVNVGQFSAAGTVSGSKLTFDADGCEVSATLNGAQLIAQDNNQCGGHNVTFSGQYRRK